MSSRLVVNSVRHTGASADAITMDASGNVTFPGNATCSGTASNFGGGKILQVVSSHKVNSFATTSSSFVDITGLSRTITPTAASSKINIIVSLNVGGNSAYAAFNLLRGSTIVTQGTNGTGNMTNCTFGFYVSSSSTTHATGYTFLDTPSYSVGDTLTYKIQTASVYNSLEVCINRNNTGANQSYSMNGTSTITLMEVAA